MRNCVFLSIKALFLIFIIVGCQSQLVKETTYEIGRINDMEIAGNYLYIATNDDGLLIYDLSNSPTLALVNQFKWAGHIEAIALSNQYGYVLLREGALHILNIENPYNIQVEGELTLPKSHRSFLDIAIISNYAVLANHSNGVYIVDLTDPQRPTIISHMTGFRDESGQLPSASTLVENVKGLLYLFGSGSVRVIDVVASPASPQILGEYFYWNFPIDDVAIEGDIAYLVDGGSLYFLDISAPQIPKVIEEFDIPDIPVSIDVQGDYVFAAALASLQIYDVSNIKKPGEVVKYDQFVQNTLVSVNHEYIYAVEAAPAGLLSIFQFRTR